MLVNGVMDKEGRTPFTLFWRRKDGTFRAQEYRAVIEDWEATHTIRRVKSEEDAVKMLDNVKAR